MRTSAVMAFAASLLFLSTSQASYFVSTATGKMLNPLRRTHVLISGRGNDLGTAPEYAAAVKAKKILEADPADQILLINVSSSDVGSGESILHREGFGSISYRTDVLTSQKLMDILQPYMKIASFHSFGHSGIVPGIYLDGIGDNDLKWTAYDPQSKRLVGHFTSDAYVTLNGCNAGHVQAPVLSKLWQVPVAATLTSTHFEVQYNDAAYYWLDEQNEKANMVLNSNATIRMRPDNANYRGMLGHYLQGLPFFKFFCVGLPQERCLDAMANSMRSVVGPVDLTGEATQEQYLAAVREWMCPTGEFGSTLQKNCEDTLAKITVQTTDRNYSPFSGNTAHCDFNGCYSAGCESSAASTAACASAPPAIRRPSTTFVDEYVNYITAYALATTPATNPATNPTTNPE